MQKSLVIVLAVCLISVHAFVKRDAPAGGDSNYVENIQKQLSELGKQVNDKLKETFNPDEIKKGFSDALNNINKAVNTYKQIDYIRDIKFAWAEEAVKTTYTVIAKKIEDLHSVNWDYFNLMGQSQSPVLRKSPQTEDLSATLETWTNGPKPVRRPPYSTSSLPLTTTFGSRRKGATQLGKLQVDIMDTIDTGREVEIEHLEIEEEGEDFDKPEREAAPASALAAPPPFGGRHRLLVQTDRPKKQNIPHQILPTTGTPDLINAEREADVERAEMDEEGEDFNNVEQDAVPDEYTRD